MTRDVVVWVRAEVAGVLLQVDDVAAARRMAGRARNDAKRLGGAERKLIDRKLDLLELDLVARERKQASAVLVDRVRASGDPEMLAALLQVAPAKDRPALMTELLVEHPASSASLRLEADGSLLRRLSDEQLARRVERLIRASRMERALADVSSRPLPAGPDGGAATQGGGRVASLALEKVRVKALVRNDKIEAGVVAARAARRALGDNPDVIGSLAWALGKAEQHRAAAELYRELEQKLGGFADDDPEFDPHARGEACFLSAFLLYEQDAFAEARTRFAACAPALVGHDREVSALWYQALMALVDDQPATAIPILEDALERYPGNEPHRHRYWLGVALHKQGKTKAARRHMNKVLRQAPLTYYGLLARRFLGAPPISGRSVAPDALAEKAAQDRPARRSRTLHILGYEDAALASVRDRPQRNMATLGLAQELGDSFLGFANGLRVRPRPQVKWQSRVKARLARSAGWRASYARPHPNLVDQAAQDHGVDVGFLYAIMRTESGFRPRALSRAGARGLLQLMPYSGRGVAKKISRPVPTADELYAPSVSIDLGSAFLGLSKREFGHSALSAACYNAGPRHVALWMDRLGHLDWPLFIERIPYRETRSYVKKTATTAAIYRGLEGQPVALELPEGPVGKPPATYTWFAPTDNE